MNFDKNVIKQEIQCLLRQEFKNLKFYLNGKKIDPQSVTVEGGIQLDEGDFGAGYNFNCRLLNLRVLTENTEHSYEGECILKVSYKIVDNASKPVEFLESIKDNKIQIKKR